MRLDNLVVRIKNTKKQEIKTVNQVTPQSYDIILSRLAEMEERITQKILQALKEAKNETEITISDEITIVKGQINKAENAIERLLGQLSGHVIAELVFIDKTTFGYLDSIPKKCGIRIITSNVKEVEKCIRKAKKCARDRPHFAIIKINKVHERWVGSNKSFFIEIGTDLKSDALGHSTHTIKKVKPLEFKKRISVFHQLWDKPQKKLREIYGKSLFKSSIFIRGV